MSTTPENLPDPAVSKAAANLENARQVTNATQQRLDAALLAEIDGKPGSATERSTAQRALNSALEDLRSAESALQAVQRRAEARAQEAAAKELAKRWKAVEKVAGQRLEVAQRAAAAAAELGAAFRELAELDQALATAPTTAPGGKERLGPAALAVAVGFELHRQGLPVEGIRPWVWGAHSAPSLESHARESAGAVLAQRPAA